MISVSQRKKLVKKEANIFIVVFGAYVWAHFLYKMFSRFEIRNKQRALYFGAVL